MTETAPVTNIQRYSLHDGPGVRTILFLKGCPLSCLWCSNPETQNRRPEIILTRSQCIGCGGCIEACGYSAVSLAGGSAVLDRKACTECFDCTEACPTGALSVTGREMTVEEAVKVLEADSVFFRRSGGGVTVSGGEPSVHPKFTRLVLGELKKIGIHTAVETCGFAELSAFEETVENADLVLFDFKLADAALHERYTGVGNGKIRKNAARAARRKDVIFRIPLIPGYTDTAENLRGLAETIAGIKPGSTVHLLPYHGYGSGKYRGLGRVYPLEGTAAGSNEKLEEIIGLFSEHPLKVTIL